jgi:hemolysin III
MSPHVAKAFTGHMAATHTLAHRLFERRAVPRAVPAGKLRSQSVNEEIANAASHGLALLLATALTPWLVAAGQARGGALGALAAAVFCGSMTFQYLASCVCHALPPGRAKLWARAVDHAAIYLFIAGSATPFVLGALVNLNRTLGLATCALIWLLALAGAWLKLTRRLTNRRWSTGLYVLLGWAAFLAMSPALWHVDTNTLMLLVAGGGAYMLGTVFFLYDHALRFGHLAWHLFVMAGSGCHVAAALC